MTTATAGNLASRTMLATLNVRMWSARKLDRAATAKTTTDAHAVADAARVNKHLMAGQDATLKAVATIAGSARAHFYHHTAAWNDDGQRIVTVDLWKPLTKILTADAADFAPAVRAFMDDYTQAYERARIALGSLYNEADFPPPLKVEAKFGFSFDFDPLPTANDFRCTLTDEDADMIRRDIEARAAARFNNAMREVWGRLFECVDKIRTTLPDYDAGNVKRFNDSLMTNLRELLAILPGLNVTQDPQLDAIGRRVAAELGNVNPQTLRDSTEARNRATQSASAICATMAAHLGMPAPAAIPEATAAAPVVDLFAPAIRAA